MPKQTTEKSRVPRSVFLVHALVVSAVIVDAINVGLMPVSLDRLGPVLVLFLAVIPGAFVFLCAYTVAVTLLWRWRRQCGLVPIVLLAILAGIAFCVLSVGVLWGVFLAEKAVH